MGYGENIFTGMIDENGTIWDMATGRKRTSLGIDHQREQEYQQTISEMQDTLDNWREILLQNGLLKLPKTPEEIAQETAAEQIRLAKEQAAQQAEINQALLQAIQGLKSEIGELKANGTNGYGVIASEQQIGQNSEKNRKNTGGSKTGPGPGETDTVSKPS